MREEYDFSQGQRGAVIASPGKARVTIYIDDDVIEAFRAQAEKEGQGYQILINSALRSAIQPDKAPVTVEVLRQIMREEMRAA